LFKNPARQIKPPRPPAREIKILTKDEIVTVIGAVPRDLLHGPVLVAVTTGSGAANCWHCAGPTLT
jgi:hypothetical protein